MNDLKQLAFIFLIIFVSTVFAIIYILNKPNEVDFFKEAFIEDQNAMVYFENLIIKYEKDLVINYPIEIKSLPLEIQQFLLSKDIGLEIVCLSLEKDLVCEKFNITLNYEYKYWFTYEPCSNKKINEEGILDEKLFMYYQLSNKWELVIDVDPI